jgi:hypothetical protein
LKMANIGGTRVNDPSGKLSTFQNVISGNTYRSNGKERGSLSMSRADGIKFYQSLLENLNGGTTDTSEKTSTTSIFEGHQAESWETAPRRIKG